MIVGIDGRHIEEKKITGIGEYTKNLLHGLSFAKIRCNLYCTKRPEKANIPKNVKLKILKAKNKYQFEQIFLPRELSKNPPDIYHATGNSGIPFFYRGISILTVHDIIPITRNRYFEDSRFPVVSKTLFTVSLKNSIHKAKKIISVSKTTQKNILKNIPVEKSKIEVIYPGVSIPQKTDFTIIKKLKLKNNNFILNNGGIDKRKNLKRLIEAMFLVKKFYPKIKLVITGENHPYQKTLINLTENAGIKENVVFTGFVNRESLWGLIKKSEFVCYTSEDEGFGLPIAEAIEAKKPILLSNIPVFKEIAKDFALFVNQNCSRSIAKGIIKLKKERALQKNLIKKSLSKKNFFSWKKTIEKTIIVYKEAIK